MSPRRNRARPAAPPPVGQRYAVETAEGDWVVRRISGDTDKTYRCPGCEGLIAPHTPHVVAWPAAGLPVASGPEARRHWHSPCWSRRRR